MTTSYLSQIERIVIVDNRSSDNTIDIARDFFRQHRDSFNQHGIETEILLNNENYSLGGSHKVAFQYCISKNNFRVVVLHGDDQADPNDFNKIFTTEKYDNFDAILGSRFMKGSRLINYSTFRKFGNGVFNVCLRLFGFGALKDMGSGLNFYRLDRLNSKTYGTASDNLTFHLYFLLFMAMSNAELKFVPISWREEDQKSNARLIAQSIELFKVIILSRIFGKKMMEVNRGKKPQLSEYGFIEVRDK